MERVISFELLKEDGQREAGIRVRGQDGLQIGCGLIVDFDGRGYQTWYPVMVLLII